MADRLDQLMFKVHNFCPKLNRIRWLIASGFMLPFFSAQAEVFRWVDDQGRVHFEDRQPNQVTPGKVKEVKVRAINVVDPVKIRSVEPSTTGAVQNEPLASSQPAPEKKKLGLVATSQAKCAAQKQAYVESKACFLGCGRVVRPDPMASARMNNADCGHCTEAVQPQC